jgi:hypothetical protein
MPIIAENKPSNYVLIPAGNHLARCYGMIQIGTVIEESGIYKGKEAHKVRISWETPHECHDFGQGMQPFAIHKEFTLSMHEKATLRKMLESWRGKPFTEEEAIAFDITKLLGKACMLQVVHKTSGSGNTYADISSIATLPKGFECPAQVNPTIELSFDNWNQNLFDSLPDFLKEKIKKSKEYSAMTMPGHSEAPQAQPSNDNDDLPF